MHTFQCTSVSPTCQTELVWNIGEIQQLSLGVTLTGYLQTKEKLFQPLHKGYTLWNITWLRSAILTKTLFFINFCVK